MSEQVLKKLIFTLGLALGTSAILPAHAADGAAVYQGTCKMCHQTGVIGAPKFGNKDDWAPRISQDIAVLEAHALKGFKGSKGTMPPKGDNAGLPDDNVKAVVAYMVNAAK